jgi:ribosomal protein S18 acetylase RimI-like enzyme
LYEIELDEHVRGRGLGREAMVAFEERARELGARNITLNVFGGNEVARSLYRSLGYVEQSVHMSKRLA